MNIRDLDIAQMLPFLEDEELNSIARQAINTEKNQGQVDIELLKKIVPFMETSEVDELLYELLEKNIPIESFAPFASEYFFQTLVDMFLAGEADHVDMNKLYPFMSEKEIKRLFAAVIKQRALDRAEAETILVEQSSENVEKQEETAEQEADISEQSAKKAANKDDIDLDYYQYLKEHNDEFVEKIEAKVKQRLLTHFFGRDKEISDEVREQFESTIDNL